MPNWTSKHGAACRSLAVEKHGADEWTKACRRVGRRKFGVDRCELCGRSGSWRDSCLFGDLPEFGAIDPEFGGIQVAGTANLLELQMSKNGFLHVDALRTMLASLGFDVSGPDMLVGCPRKRCQRVLESVGV